MRANREALHDVINDEMQLFAQSDQEAGEARRDIAKLLKDLPDRHRLPIVHVKLDGLSVVDGSADRYVRVCNQGENPSRHQSHDRED